LQLSQIVNIALEEALKAKNKKEVPVGAVIFNNKKIISKAHNLVQTKKNHMAHAEILAISKAVKKLNTINLKGYNIYSTLEPCILCSYSISKHYISKLYFGSYDIQNGSIENGTKIFNNNNNNFYVPEIYGGIGESKCSEIIKSFFRIIRKK
tara:strand:- start:71 stop:526 length:456 start_codon:yes stop_codon:yes gene_type:complete